MKQIKFLALLFILFGSAGVFGQTSKKTKYTPANERSSDTCKFCGIWEYWELESKNYLKITRASAGKFRLITGFGGLNGQINWQEETTIINNADGIYLKSVQGKLVGRFVSINFRPTRGNEFTYKITCELKSSSKMVYTVQIIPIKYKTDTEKYVATKISN